MSYRTVRLIPFIYSSTIAYKIELGNLYARFFYGDPVLKNLSNEEVAITTPYLTEHLFQLQYKQVGDVMWITHPKYAPAKLIRTDAYTFTLTPIPFKNGPFQTRNDLLTPDVDATTAMVYQGNLWVGSIGTLSCTAEIFAGENGLNLGEGITHVGALFKLTQPRPFTVGFGAFSGTGNTVFFGPMEVKGIFTFTTHGNWGGTILLERNQGGTNWDVFRTYTSHINNNAGDRNIQDSPAGGEEFDNVLYRVRALTWYGGTVNVELNINNPTIDGVVKVLSLNSQYVANVQVVIRLVDGNLTYRWAEGSWSSVLGYPSSVTFFKDRCVYLGQVGNRPVQSALPG